MYVLYICRCGSSFYGSYQTVFFFAVVRSEKVLFCLKCAVYNQLWLSIGYVQFSVWMYRIVVEITILSFFGTF